MKLFFSHIPVILETQTGPSQIIDEIDALSNTIQANLGKEIHIPKEILDSFQLKNNLNPDIWIKNTLNTKIRVKLIQIAKDFFKDLALPQQVKVADIIFTGSLANFNWSKYSDIDLHIVLDFSQFEAEPKFVEDYFYAQKAIWNQEHDISVFNFPVELYVQDTQHNLVATAIYSVLNDKWILKPKREAFKLDKKAIKDKAEHIIYQLRDIRQDYNDHQYQTVVDKVKKLKGKIKQMRSAGLERGGEFSLENLVFKVLRRTPFMDQLDSFKAKSYDKLMSVSETKIVDETTQTHQRLSTEEINQLLYTNEGFFNFNNAKILAKKLFGYTLVHEVGYGGNGAAYSTNKDTKLKFTYNENEFIFAKRSLGKKTSYMADYYKAEEIADGVYVIEMEYIDPLPDQTKSDLKHMFNSIIKNNGDYDKNLKAKVDNIKSKIGIWGNDLLNYDNYGIKNGELATYDPVSEEMIDEGEVLDNTKFKYKRQDEDEILITATYNNELIGNLNMAVMTNAYWYFKDSFTEEQYDEFFPDDKFIDIAWIQVSKQKFRGEGIAKELMKRALAKAKQQGFNRIYLNASPIGFDSLSIQDLVNFYKSFGFKEILHQGHNVQMLLSVEAPMEESVIDPKMQQHKIKKDLETKLGRRLLDSEWNNFLNIGIIPKPKSSIGLDPQRLSDILKRQADLEAKYAALRNKKMKP